MEPAFVDLGTDEMVEQVISLSLNVPGEEVGCHC